MNIQKRVLPNLGTLLLAVVTLLGLGFGQGVPARAAPLAAAVTVDLWAKTGTLTLPAGSTPSSVPIWGYTNTAAGVAQLPGPAIIVNQGDTVQVILHNALAEATSLTFGGQSLPVDLTGAVPGGTATYNFTASNPGTYLYEAGLLPTHANGQHQVAMGLFGALIVRPLTAGQAYNDPATIYTDEAILVLSEIDPNLNASPTTFDMRNYTARFWLINGEAYPDTNEVLTLAGNRVLLRYLNAGLQYHSMTLLGADQIVVATDGSLLPFAHTVVADTIAPGQTVDRIAIISAAATAGSRFALYDANLLTGNNNPASGFGSAGGMLTFVSIGGLPGSGDTTGPTTSAVALTAGTLSAMVSDAASNVTAAEYYVDSTAGAFTAMGGTFGTPSVLVNATIPAATLTSNHIFYVRGQDAVGNWGPFASVSYTAPDAVGPATGALSLAPNPSNGTVPVVLSGTANDSATGNNNIIAAEYFIGASGSNGTGTVMAVNATAPVAGLSATIPVATISALAQNTYQVYVHSKDAANLWGPFTQVALKVDKTGPTTSAVNATPKASNGTTGVSPSQPAVRVDATLSDLQFVVVAASGSADGAESESSIPATNSVDAIGPVRLYIAIVTASPSDAGNNGLDAAAVVPGTSYVKTAEGFIDAVGANGTGFPFTPSDGLFDEGTEDAYVLIPLTTINTLSSGSHTIYVHGQDGAGNWGPTGTVVFVIDKLAPTASGVTLTPPASNNTAVAVSASATDAATGNSNIDGGEFFIDNTAGAPGTGTAMTPSAALPTTTINGTIPAATIAALTTGNHTVSVRAKDAAGNWSTLVNGTLLIDRTPPTFSGITLSPTSISAGTASVNLTINGASDGGSGSGVAGGEYWFGTTNIAVGTGTQFNGTSGIAVATGTLTPGTYTVRVRIRDVAGNWSTGGNGVRTATLTVTAPVVPQPALYFSTAGDTNPPTVSGTADDADIYFYSGSAFSRSIDVTAITNPLPNGANVDGFDRVDNTHFYMSFDSNVTISLPGPDLTVQDEDVVYYNAGTWSVYFDGTPSARGLSGTDIDAINIVGGILYFSTGDGTVPSGVAGGGDDADIYSWNGTSFSRVIDANGVGSLGLPGGANVDGFVRVDATHFYMSFSSTTTTLPVIGNVEDEDVVYYNAGVWSVYFDGTAIGLTNNNHDLDAFDLP